VPDPSLDCGRNRTKPCPLDNVSLVPLLSARCAICDGGSNDTPHMGHHKHRCVRMHARTREIRVPRLVGAFAGGHIANTRTARSRLMGGMIWGIGSALHESTEMDKSAARYIMAPLHSTTLEQYMDLRCL
jgi:hypothetical protein